MSDTLRAAAQQALEALDPKNGHANHLSGWGIQALRWEAAKALRAALAEPAVKDSLTVAGDTLPPLPEPAFLSAGYSQAWSIETIAT